MNRWKFLIGSQVFNEILAVSIWMKSLDQESDEPKFQPVKVFICEPACWFVKSGKRA